MPELKIIKGGRFSDPDEIPAPPGFADQWTQEEHEEFESYLWDHSEPGCIDYAVKNLSKTIEEIEIAASVIEAIKADCDEAAAQQGIISDFTHSPAKEILRLLQRRLKEEKKKQY